MIIRPQPGPQEAFLSSKADIVLYGGSAGGGKSFALLLEGLRHINNPRFNAMIFRRNNTMIRNQGGLWDESMNMFMPAGGHPRQHMLDWSFPSGANVKFGHLEHETTVYNYQGGQICYLGFDELTHFTESQFFYLLSRNRSVCGVKPYCRMTTNPDKDSWVRRFINWWIGEDGFPIPERSGVVRYFVRKDGDILWGDTPEELAEFGIPKSFTFIPAKLSDNQILMKNDPGYLANLMAQNVVERAKLLDGNWNVSYSDFGSVLNRNDFSRYDNTLTNHKGEIIYPPFIKTYFVVDSASTTKTSSDYSVIGFFGETTDGRFYIIDWFRGRLEEPELEQKIVDMWYQHKGRFSPQGVWIEATSASAGSKIRLQRQGLPIFDLDHQGRDKFKRLNDGLGIIKSKFVHVPTQASWVDTFFAECECFRADMKHVLMDKETLPHDDQVDVLAYAISSQINLITPIGIYKRPEPKQKRVSPIWRS